MIGAPSRLRLIRKVTSFPRIDETRDLSIPEKTVVYYESMKGNLKIKPIYECRCNGRLKTKRFTLLVHTGLVVELEHLKMKTKLTNEKFTSLKGECEI